MKVNNTLIIFFLSLIFSINCAYKILEKEEFFNMQKNDKRGIDYYNAVLDDLKKILNYYVYIDLYKNPPQPEFDKNYFPKVNTYEELEKIRSEITNETNYYNFFRKIRFLIDSYRDAHMSYALKGFPFKYQFLCPIKLITKQQEDGTPYMIAELAYNNESYFYNGTKVFEIIEENRGHSIDKINGQSPFDFIQNFGGKFFNLKNPHANYAFKTHQYQDPFIIYFPFDEDKIKFEVIYENNAHFETEYAIAEIIDDEENLNENNINYFFDDINIEKEFMNYLNNYFIDNNYGVPKCLSELIKDFEKTKNIIDKNNLLYKNQIEFNYENILLENENELNNITWDYEYEPGNPKYFQCRVDSKNELNVFHIPTFDYKNLTLVIQIIKNCIELFDKNEFKIVVILDFNGGGIEDVSHTLLELIQPYITPRFYSTFRKADYLGKYYDINFEDNSIVDTCKIPDKKYVIDNTIHIDYGEDVINNVTNIFRRFGKNREEFNKEKKSLKNKRKPTEIIVFTDGYSASAASLFTKTLQNYGGAITVGYNGNPVSDDIFDGSQHFSNVFYSNELNELDEELMERMKKEGIYFTLICKTNNFFDFRDYKVPEEFNIKEVDIVSNIYEAFDENNNYQLFMDKANEIFNNYKSNCNKKNKRLTLFDDKCSFGDDKYAHGGHPCNEEGFWDLNRCIKTFCNEGYLLDYKENKCVEDPCVEHKHEESLSYNIKINKIILVFTFLIFSF